MVDTKEMSSFNKKKLNKVEILNLSGTILKIHHNNLKKVQIGMIINGKNFLSVVLLHY